MVEAAEAPVRGYAPVFAEDPGAFDRRLLAACEKAAGVVRQNLEGVTLKDLAKAKGR